MIVIGSLAALLSAGNLLAADKASQPAEADSDQIRPPEPQRRVSFGDLIAADQPVAYWNFNHPDGRQAASGKVGTQQEPLPGRIVGQVRPGQTGPRPPRFFGFEKNNQAVAFGDRGGSIRCADPGEKSFLDFDNGDTITLEAWVDAYALGSGKHAYIVGKGRTGNPGVAADNQNYALRLTGADGQARVSFLFRSTGDKQTPSDWHRWTSEAGFPLGDGWHHVAVTYRFGDGDSLQAFVDGQRVPGSWDMGGKTDRAPVVDNDELWIGAAMGGANSFLGRLDEVAIYRRAVSAERIAARFREDPSAREKVRLVADEDLPADAVLVEVIERLPDNHSWKFSPRPVTETFIEPDFALIDVPHRYTNRGVRGDRSNPFLLRMTARLQLPQGKYRLMLRSRSAGRFYIDGKLVAETPFHTRRMNAHGEVRQVEHDLDPRIRQLQPGDSQQIVELTGDRQVHRVRLELYVGGLKRRPEVGESLVAVEAAGDVFRVLSHDMDVPLTVDRWLAYVQQQRDRYRQVNAERRRAAAVDEKKYWDRRHDVARKIVSARPAPVVPEVDDAMPVTNDIDRFLGRRLHEAGLAPSPVIDDAAFLRRAALDTAGRIPSPEMVDAFFADPPQERRPRLIDRLLAGDEWADAWVGYWQDVLAENPNIVNPTLNNTGPFRWWIYESLLDNKPFDRFATELIRMEGSVYFGGPAGFGLATQNDVPMAAKAHVVAKAFLAMEMKCARCHDAPFHDFRQGDLFQLAAMLKRGPQSVPKSSSVPLSDDGQLTAQVNVTLRPGEKVPPRWPFDELAPTKLPEGFAVDQKDPRELAAALITSPHNRRFARVIVNRLWHRFLGRGLVEPVDDWEVADPSHPELLDYLARELVLSDYDLKHVSRLILNSHVYGRRPLPDEAPPEAHELFAGPKLRRMTAEQLVDSLHRAAGKKIDSEELNIDVDGSRQYTKSLNLGWGRRAWQFTSLSNERDRPSLSLPAAQTVTDVLEAFGWRSSRQNPLTVRDSEPTVLQPAILANGIVMQRVTGLSDNSAFVEIALGDQSLSQLIERVFQRILTRPPSDEERKVYVALLAEGYQERRLEVDPHEIYQRRPRRSGVSWSNHLDPEANLIKLRMEESVREGDPPTKRLRADWRRRMEDMVWALVNSPEFLFVP